MDIVKDPFGNEIMIPQSVLELNGRLMQSEEVMDDIHTVIEKPMMLFSVKKKEEQLFYLRAIGWNKIMMIGVQKIRDLFEVTNYEINPSSKKIALLHKNATQLI